MAFNPVLEKGEKVSADISFSNRPVRRLLLTNRAAYWSTRKLGFSGLFDNTISTERVPLSEVVSVTVRTQWYQGRLVVGLIMLVGSIIGAFLMVGGFVIVRRPTVAPLVDFLLFAVGMLLAFTGGRRRTLIIASDGAQFSWTAQYGVFPDEPGPSMFEQARVWAQSNGLRLEVHTED